MNDIVSILFIGIGATVVMDLWSIARQPLLGAPPPDYGMVGRWVAHMGSGRFRHDAIAKAPPVRGERLLGWVVHYLTGITFAAVLVTLKGPAWVSRPTLFPALAVGIATAVAPLLLMQPGMGAGIAASRTPRPWNARAQTILTHAFFGVGLYLSGVFHHYLNAL